MMERNENGNQNRVPATVKANKRGIDGSEQPDQDENKRRKTGDIRTPAVNDRDWWGQWIPTLALTKIFETLVTAEGALPTLCRMGAVSRYWRQVSKQSSLWHKLDLSMDCIIKQDDVLKQIIYTNNLSQLKEINLSEWKNLKDSTIQILADSCPLLTTVKLSGTGVSDAGVNFLVTNCQNLIRIDLSAMTTDAPSGKALHDLLEVRGNKIRSLSLASNSLKNFKCTMKLIETKCCELRMLDLSNVECTTERVLLDIEQLQSVCKNLQILLLCNTPFEFSYPSTYQVECSGFLQLEELDVSGCEITNSLLFKLLKRSHQLKSLNLSGCTNITWECLVKLPVTDLQQLFISNSPIAKFEGIEFIVSKWRHSLVELDLSCNMYPGMLLEEVTKKLQIDPANTSLKVLDIKGTHVSAARVKVILELFPHMECLNLIGCSGLIRAMKKEYAGIHLDQLRRSISTLVAQADVVSTQGFCF